MDSNIIIPRITTRETEQLRSAYPSLSHLEAGNVAEWLTERKDQLLIQAQTSEAEADTTRALGLAATCIGTICYAINPFMLIGGMIGGAAWLWFVIAHYNRTKEIAPLPFVRGNFLDALARMGDADLRVRVQNHLAETIKFLPRFEAGEYVFLHSDYFETMVDYLAQVDAGKRFYAYRWLLTWFEKNKGRSIPGKQTLDNHLETVKIDSRVKPAEVKAIQDVAVPRFMDSLPAVNIEEHPLLSESNQPSLLQSLSTSNTQPQEFIKLPLPERAIAVINSLKSGGFKIDEVMGSQIIAIAGNQRGGKGTLAGLLTILSSADNPALTVEYFTAGIDIYPFACNLHSALDHHGRAPDEADKLVARELLQFLKRLEGSEPYSNQNLLLVVDEMMRLTSLMSEEDRSYVLKFLLSRFEKTGATLILVLHASNLTSIAGKETGGLAATFKEGINFIGCTTQAIAVGALRRMNVASGAYFKANPNNFGEPIKGGELGLVPEWLKGELHPGNGQPDPVRSLLKIFPELQQKHKSAFLPENEKLGDMDDVSRLEFISQLEPEPSIDLPKVEPKTEHEEKKKEEPIEPKEKADKKLTNLANRLLSFFGNAKNKEPKTLADIKKKDELREQGDIKLTIALTELVNTGHLVFDDKDSWSKSDW